MEKIFKHLEGKELTVFFSGNYEEWTDFLLQSAQLYPEMESALLRSSRKFCLAQLTEGYSDKYTQQIKDWFPPALLQS